MRKETKTDQGGSVANFVVVGIILTIALFGAILYLKQHGEQARRDQAIAEYDRQTEAEENDKTEAVTTVKAAEAVATTESTASATTTSSISVNLPNTGPGSVFIESIGVFLLTMAIASFFVSKRALARYL